MNLVDQFDALLFDLDGVVYVGPHAVPGAAEAIDRARRQGVACAFVTNNAARPAITVADHLTEIGIPAVEGDVITSPQAATSVLAAMVPAGSRVLVIGGAGIEQALVERGFLPVRSLDDHPDAVMQGYSPDLTWRDLAEATFAVRTGLPWVATNPDLTFPTPRGVAPGNGSLVQVVGQTAGRTPDAVAGKPEPPLLLEAIARTGSTAPLMVGDRLDTDIAAGTRVGIPSLLVFTGVTTVGEVISAIPEERPAFLAKDLSALHRPYPSVDARGLLAQCGEATAQIVDGQLVVAGEDSWDCLRAACAVAWHATDSAVPLDSAACIADLTARCLMADSTGQVGRLGVETSEGIA